MEVTDDLGESHVHQGKSLTGKGSRAQERGGSGNSTVHNSLRSAAVNQSKLERNFPMSLLDDGNDGIGTIDGGCRKEGS